MLAWWNCLCACSMRVARGEDGPVFGLLWIFPDPFLWCLLWAMPNLQPQDCAFKSTKGLLSGCAVLRWVVGAMSVVADGRLWKLPNHQLSKDSHFVIPGDSGHSRSTLNSKPIYRNAVHLPIFQGIMAGICFTHLGFNEKYFKNWIPFLLPHSSLSSSLHPSLHPILLLELWHQ